MNYWNIPRKIKKINCYPIVLPIRSHFEQKSSITYQSLDRVDEYLTVYCVFTVAVHKFMRYNLVMSCDECRYIFSTKRYVASLPSHLEDTCMICEMRNILERGERQSRLSRNHCEFYLDYLFSKALFQYCCSSVSCALARNLINESIEDLIADYPLWHRSK